jgi:hypothetical protein
VSILVRTCSWLSESAIAKRLCNRSSSGRNGIDCRAAVQCASSQVIGSARKLSSRPSSRTRRDLPMPLSPPMLTICPLPALTC